MKRILLVGVVILLAGCSAAPAAEVAPPAQSGDISAQLSEKDGEIAVLEYQLEDLREKMVTLQADYDTLLAASAGQAPAGQPSGFLCEEQLDTIRYTDPNGTIAILEGWFATQPFVQETQGTYSTTFWDGVNSRVHTIRYISADDGLTTTANFLIMFEEAGWQPGILYMTKSCWLDYPY